MTIETFKKAEEIYKKIVYGEDLICEARAFFTSKEAIDINKSAKEAFLDALIRGKEKLEKELEAL